MEAVNDDDEAMMAMMGLTGFGSTKVVLSGSLPSFPRLTLLVRANTSLEIKTVLLTLRSHEHGDST
jgi:U4/U6.U5 small nuclear ribonucleoproteins